MFLILSDLASGFLYDHVDGAFPVGLDWRSIIYRAELRDVSGSLMTLVLLLCLCGGITGLQPDYDRRHFIIRGTLYLTALLCVYVKRMVVCYVVAPNNAVQLPEC